MSTRRRPPFLPTTLETALLLIYPSILLIGSLFGLLDPNARAAPYNASSQSHYAATAPSYFAKKSNVFNIFFVKQGWAWVTFSYFFFLLSHPHAGKPFSLSLTPRRIRGTVRWGIVTVWWIFVTQWFFGPAIIDRGFTLTGGQCELVREAEAGNVLMDEARQFVTGVACKAVGGKWKGGHDISGHVFLLVLGSMFLFEEVLYVVWRAGRGKEERTIVMDDGAVKSAEVEKGVEGEGEQGGGRWGLTGLLVALSGIFIVYFLPRMVPVVRGIIGMPGI
ncbi:inositol phospholipid synthesis and fat-storage-inducing TM-domain-containing protein [Halenospora varia]|nr:inositol phospholipid synthesis and fat-storage-inducing TM-domain-containing protein [Halenospora varia]